jgi:hypothetical protein
MRARSSELANGWRGWYGRGGYKVTTQPDAFAVVNGKLYLNYSAEVQKLWQKDVRGYIATAEKKWPDAARTQPRD